jgi:serine/threonine protein kinase
MGRVSDALCRQIALEAAQGLAAIHAQGIVHRDLKPENVQVNASHQITIMDLGVALVKDRASRLTQAHHFVGSIPYASPEQLRGEDLDVRSDIYSVGATLYHLLTGATPFSATDFVKLITEVLDKEPAAPSTLRPDLPVELSKLLLRCLAKDRKVRFQTYAELRDALLPFRAVAFVPANPARRFLAGLVDYFIAFGPCLAFVAYWGVGPDGNLVRERTLTATLVAARCGWTDSTLG